jgi:hypothetical protein
MSIKAWGSDLTGMPMLSDFLEDGLSHRRVAPGIRGGTLVMPQAPAFAGI